MNEVRINLTPNQKKKLAKAIKDGTDFSTKLKPENLKGDDILQVGKVQMKKLEKHRTLGKGMVVKMNSKQVGKLKNKMYQLDEPIAMPKKVKGGAITVATAMASIGMVNEFINDHPGVKNFIAGIVEDIAYLINNPMALSYRFIVAIKIPNMNKRYRDIVINIERLKKIIPSLKNQNQVKRHQRRIINLETLSQKVANHIQTLLERIPYIKEMAEERNETLKERKAEQLKKQIEKTENQLDALKKKDDEAEGEGLQVDGRGVVMDKIKNRIKKNHLEPMIENEKAKMKKIMHKEVENAKKKAEQEVKQKIKSEINKQKSKLPVDIPLDLSKIVGVGLQVDAPPTRGRGHKKKN